MIGGIRKRQSWQERTARHEALVYIIIKQIDGCIRGGSDVGSHGWGKHRLLVHGSEEALDSHVGSGVGIAVAHDHSHHAALVAYHALRMQLLLLCHLVLEGVVFLPHETVFGKTGGAIGGEEIEWRVRISAVGRILDAIRMIQLRHSGGLEDVEIGFARNLRYDVETGLAIHIAKHHPAL